MNMIQGSSNPHDTFLSELLKPTFSKSKTQKLYNDFKIDINHLNSKNESFLHISLFEGKIDAALWLINQGIALDTFNSDGQTAFDIAVENQNHRVAKILLDKAQFNIDRKDKHGRTKLQDSIMLGDHEMAKILIEHGADLNSKDNKGQNLLNDALSYGNMDFIKYLLGLEDLDINNIDNAGNNILHHQYALQNDDLALELIKNGVNPNIRNSVGDTYLSLVALRGLEAFYIIETALESGFDINTRVANQNTILMEVLSALSNTDPADIAKRNSLLQMSQKLIEIGIDINAVNEQNEHALFQTIKAGDIASTKLLIEKDIDLNIQNKNGETALFYACYGGIEKLELTILLLRFHADPLIKNNKNQTIYEILNNLVLSTHGNFEYIDNDVLKYAISGSRFMNVLKAIFKYSKQKLDFLDSSGDPIFFKPLLYNNISLFKLYNTAGVDLKLLNKDGKNIFFEYVLKVFQDNDESVDFETGLSMLISAKVNHNVQDETGWTVVSKIVAQTPCNILLFRSLLKRVRFDYKLVDKLGRTVIHSAVWSNNIEVIKLINNIDNEIKNIPDHYGILPVIYAALIGNKNVLLYLIDIKSKVKTNRPISQAAIKKFTPLLKNIDKLLSQAVNLYEENTINNINLQLRRDFIIT